MLETVLKNCKEDHSNSRIINLKETGRELVVWRCSTRVHILLEVYKAKKQDMNFSDPQVPHLLFPMVVLGSPSLPPLPQLSSILEKKKKEPSHPG